MATIIPNDAKKSILNQEFDWSGNTYKISLHTSSFTPDKDATTFFSDVTNEVTGDGYTAGGETLSNVSVTVDDANDLAYLDADDVVWSNATFTTRYAVIYEDTGTDATSKVVLIVDYGADRSPFQDDFTHQFASDGFIKLTE